MRRTKILATLGPATSTPEKIRELLEAGMDAVRVNFSHGTHKDHERLVEAVREAADALGRPVPIVQDIQGPKIRVGDLPGGQVVLEEGDEVVFYSGERAPTASEIPITYDLLAADVSSGDRILMDDGRLEARVTAVDPPRVTAEVVFGGALKDHKGVNVPGVHLSVKSVTDKDRVDLAFGQQLGVDYVAASFVRSATDIARVRADIGDETFVIAKVEQQEALDNIEEVVKASDAVLLARGDLGVELPPEEVPVVQKEVLWLCNLLGTPVITATQMLESMTTNPRPTRAEASDVANAIADGTGAIMLSGETATGDFPATTVRTMARIAKRAEEAFLWDDNARRRGEALTLRTVPDAIAHATVTVAEDLDARAIVTPTNSGATARMVSKYRPRTPIIAITPDARTQRQLALLWGVTPLLGGEAETEEGLMEETARAILDAGLAEAGDTLVITSGQLGVTGTTNHLRVRALEDAAAEAEAEAE